MNGQDLKNSILQLVIQGKLVEQREEEGTAKELIGQIKAEKKRLIKEKKIRKESPLNELTEDEVPFRIPDNWEWVKLGEVVSVYGGKRIPVGRSLTDEDTGHKYIRVADMKNGSVILDNIKYVPVDIYEKIKKYTISKDDVYITVAGTIGQVGIVPEELDNANLTENANKLVVYSNYRDYIFRILESGFIQYQIKEYTTKVGQPKLAIKRIRELIIPIPPLEEQKRIVAKIEELMPYVEKYEKTYSEVEELNKKFPEDMQKSILQYAIQGKLVEQREEEGNAEELYQLIQEEKARLIREGKIKKEGKLPEITEDEIPFDIPENWKWVSIGQVCSNIMYGTSKKSSKEGKIAVLRMGNLQGGIIDYDNLVYTSDDGDIQKYKLEKNDLLFNRTNSRDLVGKTAIYKSELPAIYAGYLVRFTPVLVSSDYINFVMQSNYYWRYCQSVRSDAIGQSNINAEKLKRFVFPLPPMEEQKRIVARLEEILPITKQLVK